MPTEKLQELSARFSGTPQGRVIQQALQQRQAMPTAMPQNTIIPTPAAQPGMRRGGFVPQHFDSGGGLNSPQGSPVILTGGTDDGSQPTGFTPIPGSLPPLDVSTPTVSAPALSPRAGGLRQPMPQPTTGEGIPNHDEFMKNYNAEVANAQPYNKVDPWLALGVVGAGMLASRSPFAGVALGEGMQAGLENYGKQKQEAAEEALKKGDIEAKGEGLYQQAVDAKNTMNYRNEEILKQQEQLAEQSRHNKVVEEQGKYTMGPTGQVMNTKTGLDPEGNSIVSPFASTQPVVGPNGETLTGEAYKKELERTNPQMASTAEAVVNGDYQITPYMLTRQPQIYQPIWNAARQIDPTVSMQRYGYKKEFLTGNSPDAKNIDTFNTVGSHLSLLQQAAQALDNGDNRALNAIRNTWRTQMGSELPTNLDAAKTMVAGELVKAVTSGGGVTDREKYEKEFSQNASNNQLQGAVGVAKSLINQRINAAAYRYKNTIGGDYRANLIPDVQKYLSAPIGLSLPSSKDDLVPNQIYQTSRGLATWNGSNFMPVAAP